MLPLIRFIALCATIGLAVFKSPAAAQGPDPGTVAVQMQIESNRQAALAMNRALSERIAQLEARLAETAEATDSLQNSLATTNGDLERALNGEYLANVEDIIEDIDRSVEKIVGIKYEIATFGLGITGLIATLLVAIGAAAAWVFQRWLKGSVIEDVHREINSKVQGITAASTAKSIAETLSKLSFLYWNSYGEDFIAFLSKEAKGEPVSQIDFKHIKRESSLALSLARSGLQTLDAIKGDDISEDQKLKYARRRLLLRNHIAYNSAVEAICRHRLGTLDEQGRLDILHEAESLHKRSKEAECAALWYEFQDAAALVFRFIGNEEQATRSKSIVNTILGGHSPTDKHEQVSEARKIQFREAYGL